MMHLEEPNNQWIGLRENLQENPHDLNRKITLVSCKFSLKPIHSSKDYKWIITPIISGLTLLIPFIMGKSTISMAIFHCYVSLPKGILSHIILHKTSPWFSIPAMERSAKASALLPLLADRSSRIISPWLGTP